jgi:serine/threonine protein kinase
MPEPTLVRCPQCRQFANASDRLCGSCGASLTGAADTGSVTTSAFQPSTSRILEALRTATLGDYDIAGELGRGGMAVVFLAHDIHLNRKVAIKALLPDLLFIEGMDRRFKHEARIAAKLDHPNIFVIYNVREANNLLFIVMKLVEGLTLGTILKRAGPLPISVARLVARQVASALAYAHGEGVVHRDVKPANIMVDRRGNVVVMDFGIAKAADDAHLTQTGLVVGTPAYMSPEQCLARPVTSASDQYSLGLVTYELLAGHPPFRGSALEMQWAHATAEAPPVQAERVDCPDDLAAAVARMLAKHPEERWASLQDLVDTLGDDSATENTARRTLAALVNAAPDTPAGRVPTTPISPVPRVSSATRPPLAAPAASTPSSPPAPVEQPAASPAEPPAPDVQPPTLTVAREHVRVEQGDSIELSVQVSDGFGEVSVGWTSSDPTIVEVNDTGIITAKRLGTAEVYAAVGGHRAVCVVEVTPTRYVSLEVSPPDATIVTGERVSFSAAGVTTSGRTTAAQGTRWRTLQKAVAAVDASGVVEARAEGSTDVVASVEGVEARAHIHVVPVPVALLHAEPPSLHLKPGKKTRVTVSAVDASGTVLSGRDFHWKTSDDRIVTVSQGQVRANAVGEALVTVTCDGCVVEIPVSVDAPPAPVSRPPSDKRPVRVPRQAVAAAVVLFGVTGIAFWVSRRPTSTSEPTPSAQPALPDVRQAGPVAPVAPPPQTQPNTPTTAKDKSITPEPAATPEPRPQTPVVAKPPTLSTTTNGVATIAIGRIAGPLEPGDSIHLEARALGQSNRPAASAVITWRSSMPRVVTVSASGWVRAIAPGTGEIVASVGNVRQAVVVAVSEPRARRVVVDTRSSRVTVGDSVRVSGRALDRSGLPIAGAQLQWIASPAKLGSVDERGVFTARSAGRVLVIASANAAADTIEIEIAERVAQVLPPQDRPATPAPVTATAVSPAPSPTDSGRGKIVTPPPLAREAAVRLFDELVAAINARSADRIGQVYGAQPDAAETRLRKEFLDFVRDDMPRAKMQSITLQPNGADASTVVAAVEFVWKNNAGIGRTRVGTFSGVATLVNAEWRVTGVRVSRKFW